MHQGRFFKIIPFDNTGGNPWDINKIEQVILQIENIAEIKGPNYVNSLGVLTTLDRNTWAEVHCELICSVFHKPQFLVINISELFVRNTI